MDMELWWSLAREASRVEEGEGEGKGKGEGEGGEGEGEGEGLEDSASGSSTGIRTDAVSPSDLEDLQNAHVRT